MLQGQPLKIQTFLSLSFAIALLMIKLQPKCETHAVKERWMAGNSYIQKENFMITYYPIQCCIIRNSTIMLHITLNDTLNYDTISY